MIRKNIPQKLRLEILTRDKHTCRMCGRSAPDVELQVDHDIPVAFGGLDEPRNLQALCVECNSSKGAKVMRKDSDFVSPKHWRMECETVMMLAARSLGVNQDDRHMERCLDLLDHSQRTHYAGCHPCDISSPRDSFVNAMKYLPNTPFELFLALIRTLVLEPAQLYQWAESRQQWDRLTKNYEAQP